MVFGPTFTRTTNHRLTGRVRFRAAFERKGFIATDEIVGLRVHEEFDQAQYSAPPRSDADLQWRRLAAWRDATPLDLADPALRWLIDGSERAAISSPPAPPAEK